MNEGVDILGTEAITLLKALIVIPSYSKEEDHTADLLQNFFSGKNITAYRSGNNVFAVNSYFDKSKPSILLNSHHDTVRPNKGYTLDPFMAIEKDQKLYGLGSNDAGGCLVSLLAVFRHFYERKDMRYNIVYAATAEEEISGTGGIEALLKDSLFIEQTAGAFSGNNKDSFAIVGEPTQMHLAVAERGLMVLDGTSYGKAGHAAREEGENAITKAIKDIEWFSSYRFPKVSDLLGPVKMNVTVIETENKAHNVVPAQCRFVVDVRVNECYSFEDILATITMNVQSEMKPRSTRLRSSSIAADHPVVKAGISLGRVTYGSPTTSDKALMPFPALKIGPGDSARSHTADEYIYKDEIFKGIELYIELLNQLV